ncbi:glycosyltransferase [Nocardia terpenica]|uniref:Glycosyltransferase n=1 Tax=Nocardia terpenica TaxID=455432 RepID=A0A6G9YX75_9NOCA|nr:glycosyltransferase [Nocardia terpenica]QIS17792.1 glycosyltransferase [Nocardia terpenica]
MTPRTIVTFGRVEDAADNALTAARIVARLGGNLRLIVRGAPPQTVQRAAQLLSAQARREVEVRPYTSDLDSIMADIAEADVVIVPVRSPGFDNAALAAAIAGVPILVPDIGAIGIYLSDARLYPVELTRPMLVEQDPGTPVPLDRWADRLHAVLTDLPAARERARALQGIVHGHNRTPAAAQVSLAAIEHATAAARTVPGPEIPRGVADVRS